MESSQEDVLLSIRKAFHIPSRHHRLDTQRHIPWRRAMVYPPPSSSSLIRKFNMHFFRFGENRFQEAQRLSSRADTPKVDWPSLRYMVFDIPHQEGKTYQERYSQLGMFFFPLFLLLCFWSWLCNMNQVKYFENKPSGFIRVAEKVECTGSDHMEACFQDIIAKGGEGIILRDPSSPYQPGRSPGYLKHKVCHLPLKNIEVTLVFPEI